MSLKAFHIVFVTASILLSLGFGGWALNGYFQEGGNLNLAMGISAMVLAAGLGVYGRFFLKKLKHISYL